MTNTSTMKSIITLWFFFYWNVMSQTAATVEEIISEIEEEAPATEVEGATEGVEGAIGPIYTLLSPILGPHKMGDFITCLEQNDEIPYGYKEKLTYGNLESETCALWPHLCNRYVDCDYDPTYCNEGDVCDHDDPSVYDENNNRLVRDVCKMQIMFLPEIDEEKSFAWKCARHEICPLKHELDMNIRETYYYDRDGNIQAAGKMGCLINTKRAMCCCDSDYCQGNPIWEQYASFGNPDKYPHENNDFQKIANINPMEFDVVYEFPEGVIIPDWVCINNGGTDCVMPPEIIETPVTDPDTDTETDSGTPSPITPSPVDIGYVVPVVTPSPVEPIIEETVEPYTVYSGQQCWGSITVVSYTATVEECKQYCLDTYECVGFVYVNTGTYAGQCFLRGGELGDPYPWTFDDRDCYVPNASNASSSIPMVDLVIIFGFFVIAALCCGIGVFIGSKMGEGSYEIKQKYVDDIGNQL